MIDISNVIRLSFLQAQKGLAEVNTSVLAILSHETPIPSSYGSHRIYFSSGDVVNDFGSNSITAKLAEIIFSQSANLITGGGHLVIIPQITNNTAQPATIIASGVDLTKLPQNGGGLAIKINGGLKTLEFPNIDKTSISTIQNSLNSVNQEIEFKLTGELSSAQLTLKTKQPGSNSSLEVISDSQHIDIATILNIAGKTAQGSNAGTETVKDSIIRTMADIQYFGIISTLTMSQTQLLEAANLVQSLDKILFYASADSTIINDTFKKIKDKGLTHTRCLAYLRSTNQALEFAAGYASRALSCHFSGVKTMFTMHLKDITGIQDDIIDQTTVNLCQDNGVDTYPSLGGIGKVFCSGANMFYDQVYSRLALKLKVQIALFNCLATTSTKIPQTEDGINAMKSAIRKVLAQFVANGTIAPGTWTSSTYYGNPQDHIRNIKDFGYYIYSQPIAQQPVADRQARKAPLIQLAAKDAGAVHNADITMEVEA